MELVIWLIGIFCVALT